MNPVSLAHSLALVLMFSIFHSTAQAAAPSCGEIFAEAAAPRGNAEADRAKALAAVPKFMAYFGALNERMLERKNVLDLASVALIAEEHLLLMGPPGNAKSQISDLFLGNIKDNAGKTSYYRIQMTPETTMSETHGPMDFKKLNDTGRQERIYGEGMLHSRNVFIDEIFDARSNAQRNILGFLAERAHAQGPNIIKGDIETVIAATNKYISEVYEKAGDDGPKAVLDRFAFSTFVPATFESTDSYMKLIQRHTTNVTPIPNLTFDEVESIRKLTGQVEISAPVAKALALLSYRMKAETEALELSSIKTYKEKLKNGEEASIPYRATKFHSPRTLAKSANILRAFIVKDWVEHGGARKLEATIQDLAQLEKFFTLNGPSDDFVKAEIKRTSNLHERSQLMSILQEREIFQRNLDKIVEEMDTVSVKYALSDLSGLVVGARTAAEKQAAIKAIVSTYAKVEVQAREDVKQSELTGEDIGLDYVRNYLQSLLKGLMPASDYEHIQKTVFEEIARKKQEGIDHAIAEKKREEAARLEETKRAERAAHEKKLADERAAKVAKELEAAFSDAARFQKTTIAAIDDPRNGNIIMAKDPNSDLFVIYSQASDTLKVYNLTGGTITETAKIQTALGSEKFENISKISVMGPDSIYFTSDSGKGVHKLSLSTKMVETESVSMKNVGTAVDPKTKRIISIDPQNLKVKFISAEGVTTSEAFNFISGDLPRFKNEMAYAPRTFEISRDGTYGVLVDITNQSIYKVDFAKKTVSLVKDNGRRLNVAKDTDQSTIAFYEGQTVVTMDLSQSEPEFKELKVPTGDVNIAQGLTAIPGSSLLLTSSQSVGPLVIDGASGVQLLNHAFGIKDRWTGYFRTLGDGVFAITTHNGHFNLQIIKVKK